MLVEHVADQALQNQAPALENAFVAHYGFDFAPPAKNWWATLKGFLKGENALAVEHWLAW